jgi:hypothetical protein
MLEKMVLAAEHIGLHNLPTRVCPTIYPILVLHGDDYVGNNS